jgi:glycosyltransferase involved in cell wall biosynthesis
MARGEYLAFLDSDDEWLPGKLERQLETFATTRYPNLGAVQCAVVVVVRGDQARVADAVGRSHGGWVLQPPVFSGDAFDRVLATLGMPSTGSVAMVHRRVIEAGIRFDESLPAYEDYEFFLAVSKAFQIETLTAPLSIKHEEFDGPHVWNGPNIITGARGVIEKYRAELQRRPRAMARRRYSLAMSLFRAGRVAEAREQLRAVAALRVLNPGAWLWLGVGSIGAGAYVWLYPKLAADRKLRRLAGRIRSLAVGVTRRSSQADRAASRVS